MLLLPEIMVNPSTVDFREGGHNEFMVKHTEFVLSVKYPKMLILTTSGNEKNLLQIFILSNPFLNIFVINIMKRCPLLYSNTNLVI